MWKNDKPPYRIVMNSKAASGISWHCKHYVGRRVMKHFKSGHDLAKEMGIPVSNLKKTFDEYNQYAEDKKNGKNTDPFGKIFFTNAPFSIDDSFYVGWVTPVIHYTMGGLSITPKCECISESSRTIPGLFA